MKTECLPARNLTADVLNRWDEIVRSTPAFTSPFFRPEYVQAVSRLRQNVEVGIIRNGDEVLGIFPFERVAGCVARPVGGRLSDYQAVIAVEGLQWQAADLMRACRLRCWEFDHHLAFQQQLQPHFAVLGNSWQIDVSQGLDAFIVERKAAGAEALTMRLRKFRKLNREHEVHFEWHVADERALEMLMAWKSKQYQNADFTDLFAHEWVVTLLKTIVNTQTPQFAGVLSVLYVDKVPKAVHLGMRSGSQLHYWFPAYDASFGKYSPGSALLIFMIKYAGENGVTSIDLGKGDDDYKLTFANNSVPLAEGVVETRPLVAVFRRVWRKSREFVRASPIRTIARAPSRWLRRIREWQSMR